MPQKAWNAKRERQYEHIKDRPRGPRHLARTRPQEIAARTVNKERARAGEATDLVAALTAGHLVRPPRRAALRHGTARRAGRATSSTTRRSDMGIEGRSKMNKEQLQRAVDRQEVTNCVTAILAGEAADARPRRALGRRTATGSPTLRGRAPRAARDRADRPLHAARRRCAPRQADALRRRGAAGARARSRGSACASRRSTAATRVVDLGEGIEVVLVEEPRRTSISTSTTSPSSPPIRPRRRRLGAARLRARPVTARLEVGGAFLELLAGRPGDAGAAAPEPPRRPRRVGRGALARTPRSSASRSTTSSTRRTRSRSSSGGRTASSSSTSSTSPRSRSPDAAVDRRRRRHGRARRRRARARARREAGRAREGRPARRLDAALERRRLAASLARGVPRGMPGRRPGSPATRHRASSTRRSTGSSRSARRSSTQETGQPADGRPALRPTAG